MERRAFAVEHHREDLDQVDLDPLDRARRAHQLHVFERLTVVEVGDDANVVAAAALLRSQRRLPRGRGERRGQRLVPVDLDALDPLPRRRRHVGWHLDRAGRSAWWPDRARACRLPGALDITLQLDDVDSERGARAIDGDRVTTELAPGAVVSHRLDLALPRLGAEVDPRRERIVAVFAHLLAVEQEHDALDERVQGHRAEGLHAHQLARARRHQPHQRRLRGLGSGGGRGGRGHRLLAQIGNLGRHSIARRDLDLVAFDLRERRAPLAGGGVLDQHGDQIEILGDVEARLEQPRSGAVERRARAAVTHHDRLRLRRARERSSRAAGPTCR